MAFENHIVASMNNPEAAAAWREAERQHLRKMLNARRAKEFELIAERLVRSANFFETLVEKLQNDLKASREENRALHEELGKLYESSENALDSLQMYCSAYFNQRVLTRSTEKTAYQLRLVLFAVATVQATGAWGALLARLS